MRHSVQIAFDVVVSWSGTACRLPKYTYTLILVINKVLHLCRSIGAVLDSGFSALLTDWDKMLALAGGVSLLAFGVYSAKGATSVTARYVEARLGMFH